MTLSSAGASKRIPASKLIVTVSVAALAAASCATTPSGEAAEIAALRARVAALSAEAQLLEDVEAVKRLQRAYAFYVDKGYWDEAADLFASDGTLEVGVDGVYVGQDRVRAAIVAYGGGNPGPGLPFGQYNHRMHLQPVVHIAPDGLSAQARWREIAMVGQFQEEAFWGDAVLENRYVKRDGVWQIAAMRVYTNFVAPYEGGWASLPEVEANAWASDVAQALPADRPPTESYAPFPSLFTPTYHYEATEAAPGAVADPAPTAAPTSPAVAELAAVVDGYDRSLDRLRSMSEIENLQGMFGYYVDKGLWTDAASLFAEEGTYEFGQGGVYVGRDRVEAALGLMGPEGLEEGQLNNYPQLQPIITVADDNQTAKARWRSDVQLSRDGAGRWGAGVYENEYVNDGGVWKISKLHYYVTMWADYERGWAQGAALPMDGASRTLPPDQPPTEVYESLPGVYLPPYHYVHPVTGEPHPGPGLREDWSPEPVGSVVAGGTPTTDLGRTREGREVEALGARVEALEDVAAIERVQRAYGYYVDVNQYYDMTDLFTEGSVYEIGGRGMFVGKPRVFEYSSGLGPSMEPRQGIIFNHQQLQPIVTLAPDGEHASARLQAWVVAVAQWGDVTYENQYVKEDGVWKISRIFAPFNMYTDYTDGWGVSARPANRPDSFGSPPDYPPSVVTLNYPNFYVAPFHFANPVTGRMAPPPNPAAGGVASMTAQVDAGR